MISKKHIRSVLAISLLSCTVLSSAHAEDFRVHSNALFLEAGWDLDALEEQTQGNVYLRAQIKKLKQENAQLRHSLSQARTQIGNKAESNVQNRVQSNAQIQALVEENNRLSALLERKDSSKDSISALYEQKISSLEQDKRELEARLGSAKAAEQGKQDAEVTFYKRENERLKSQVASLSSKEKEIDNADKTRVLNLEQTVKSLRDKNSELIVALENASKTRPVDESLIKTKDKRIEELQDTVLSLQEDNARLVNTVSEANQKLANVQLNADSGRSQEAAAKQRIIDLQQDIALLKVENTKVSSLKSEMEALKQKNQTLEAKLAVQLAESTQKQQDLAAIAPAAHNSSEVEELKKQNESLRETIRAQTESLLAADNASQSADRFLTENTMLQRKLELAAKSNSDLEQQAKMLLEQNKKLQSEIVRRDEYIRHKGGTVSSDGSELMAQRINRLEEELKKEKTSITEYRKKIREYQAQIGYLDKSTQGSDLQKEFVALKLENQELKARLQLQKQSDDQQTFQINSYELLEQRPQSKSVQTFKAEPDASFALKSMEKNGDANSDALPPINGIPPALVEPASGLLPTE
ncbi:MAG: hypothetical protein GC137_09125 [Alphaproteobacteria bacterium]|nr:hypothetical protein [Alphaproteobacteria bacterium]